MNPKNQDALFAAIDVAVDFEADVRISFVIGYPGISGTTVLERTGRLYAREPGAVHFQTVRYDHSSPVFGRPEIIRMMNIRTVEFAS